MEVKGKAGEDDETLRDIGLEKFKMYELCINKYVLGAS